MPKRTNEHRIETESTFILRELIANEAIFREISERDYGIDGMVEFFHADGHVDGEEISVQIKGSRDIAVKKGFVRTPSIKTDTVKYWTKKKQSVFILLVDVSKKLIYFEDAKRLARAQAKKVNNQKTISFSISESNVISSNNLKNFRRKVFIADKFDQSKSALSKMICNFKDIYKKLIVNSGRDCFIIIDQDDPRIDLLNDISKNLRLCWYFFGIHAQVHDFNHFMRLSYEAWKHEYVEMHITETANYLKEQFHFLLFATIVTKETYDVFWGENDKEVINRLNRESDFNLMKEVAKGKIGIENSDLLDEYFS